jgi:tripartite-type tricarboxylate transporter receptor subunit TctC
MVVSGVPGVEVLSWAGLFLPAKTSIEIVGKVHSGTVTALADPAIRMKLEQGGAVVTGSTPDALASFLHSEMEKWGAVIKEANIRAQ